MSGPTPTPVRSDDYRYTVEVDGAEITPLASLEAYVGDRQVRVLNISLGGVALLMDREPTPQKGDLLDISVSIREHAFPVQVEVRGTRGLRLACAFLNPSRVFQGALREFLKPKFLGRTLEANESLSQREDVLGLVQDATHYEAFIGQNQTGVFVWTRDDRSLLKLVSVSQDLIFEWSFDKGLRTGRMGPRHQAGETQLPDSDFNWSRFPEPALVHYFADILLAGLRGSEGPRFVERLVSEEMLKPGAELLKFPELPGPSSS
jgi:hypothetical protein